jgi:hypothetical protein
MGGVYVISKVVLLWVFGADFPFGRFKWVVFKVAFECQFLGFWVV